MDPSNDPIARQPADRAPHVETTQACVDVVTRRARRMIPGEFWIDDGEIELNAGREKRRLVVANTGDRPIQVGSHYHFFETNAALAFERDQARGFRLDIAAGTAVRFEPGQTRTVDLVALAGDRIVHGFAGRIAGPLA